MGYASTVLQFVARAKPLTALPATCGIIFCVESNKLPPAASLPPPSTREVLVLPFAGRAIQGKG